jgi:hypothetical protein
MGSEAGLDLFDTAAGGWDEAYAQLEQFAHYPYAAPARLGLQRWQGIDGLLAPRLNIEPGEIECYWKHDDREVMTWFRVDGMEVAWYCPELKAEWSRPRSTHEDVTGKLRWLLKGTE